jgi:hypothetical protein
MDALLKLKGGKPLYLDAEVDVPLLVGRVARLSPDSVVSRS